MNLKHSLNSVNSFIEHYLKIYNISVESSQRLSPKEIELISLFCILPEKYKHHRFSIHGKRQVIRLLKEHGVTTNVLALNLKLQSLVKKKFLIRDDDRVLYLPKHLLSVLDKIQSENKFTITIEYVIEHNKQST